MKNLKVIISISILLVINFIFLFKYLDRITSLALLVALFLVIVQLFVFRYSNRIKISNSVFSVIHYGFVFGLIALVILVHVKIPYESLNVDRWSVISSFWNELFSGSYPYYAKSHMGNPPGPMPVYFFISLPFYLIGELSIFSCLGYIIFSVILFKHKQYNLSTKSLMFYLITCAFTYWEIATRSNVFTNSAFVVLLLIPLNHSNFISSYPRLKLIILAILTGLLLSTRSIYALVYIVFFLSLLTNKETPFKTLFIFLLVAGVSFFVTFLPFVVFFKDEFFTLNPFIIQSSFLVPQSYTVGFIILAFVMAFFVKNQTDRFFYSGLILFISIMIYALYLIVKFGYQEAFIESKIDISYFIFCVPFLMYYLVNKNYNLYHTTMLS